MTAADERPAGVDIPGPMPSASRFQILSLDGGGSKAIFSAAVLARLEEDLGCCVTDHFDLIVGTSAGGIIALGLGHGLSPKEIVEFFLDEVRTVFPGPRFLHWLRRFVKSKYDGEGLRRALRSRFGESLLGESQVPLVIPAYDLGENDVHLFKTPHHSRLTRDWQVPNWEVAAATSAAPTYFPAHRLQGDGSRLVDGGVWANNPAMVGVTEAVSLFGRRLDEIRVLSLGTTSGSRARPPSLDRAGLVRWGGAPNIVDVLLAGQGTGSFTQVQHLVGRENAYRLNPPVLDGELQLDGLNTDALIAKAAHHSRRFSPTFDNSFRDHNRAPYTPYHGPKAEAQLS
ncbi:MAG: patatin-like phospholipase family protein [Acidobacteriia bacterium]|nr:patatin-like phospholipase family protein [Terriglobia bacterium]